MFIIKFISVLLIGGIVCIPYFLRIVFFTGQFIELCQFYNPLFPITRFPLSKGVRGESSETYSSSRIAAAMWRTPVGLLHPARAGLAITAVCGGYL